MIKLFRTDQEDNPFTLVTDAITAPFFIAQLAEVVTMNLENRPAAGHQCLTEETANILLRALPLLMQLSQPVENRGPLIVSPPLIVRVEIFSGPLPALGSIPHICVT